MTVISSRSSFRQALGAACLLALAAPAAGDGSHPGILDLSGPWSYRLGDGGEDAEGWRQVDLPAPPSALGLTTGLETLRLRRDVALGADWTGRLAPSGLALLVGNSFYGNYEVTAAGSSVGAWSGPLPGLSPPAPRLFSLPADAVGGDGRLRLTLTWHWRGWAPGRALRQDGRLGEGWLLGDLERLRAEAELRRLEGLNADLPLVILVLLYAAVGAYHLQLFRRDPRCREYLWFGLTALVVALRTALYTHWISGLTEHYVVVRRLIDVTGALTVALSIQFLWPFLSRPIGRALKAYQLSFVALAAGIAALPEAAWLPHLEALSKVWSAPFLVAVAWLLAAEARRGNLEARTIAVGGFAIVVAGAAEIASQLAGRGETFPLQAVAFALFAASMAFSLSNRFTRVHQDLDAVRQQLEEMVDDRVSELSTANERLQSEIAERELAQGAMRLLERAVEQSIDGILVAGLDEKTLYINDAWARQHGQETFEVFGRGIDLFHTPEQMDAEVRPALEQVRREGSWEGEIDHVRKDGSIFPAWMSATLLRDPAGEPVGFVAVARDISERRAAERRTQRIETRIRETEKLRSLAELAGGIAHDYNNLLTGVLVHSSLALREVPADSPAADKLHQIAAAAERAADLTAQLFSYAGAESPVRTRTDLGELVRAARDDWRSMLGDSARLEIELAEGLPEVEIDPAQVRQAIENLVSNAVDAVVGVGGGVVRVETGKVSADRAYLAGSYPDEDHPRGDYVFVRVKDSGPGIDETWRRRIFDPFFTTKTSARGLGLATVLATVRAHEGTIKVTSAGDAGSTFELLFPVAERPEQAAAAEPRHRPWQGSGTVLVVDDEQIMREVSRSILEQSGFEVLATGEGRRALDLYRRHRSSIRLVLLDRTMPTMSGEAVLEEILALDPQARVLLMSGYKQDAVVRQLTHRGLADFLPKPFRPEELLAKVRSVLEPAGPKGHPAADSSPSPDAERKSSS